MAESYELDVDLSKSFVEILMDGPKNELEIGIVEFVGKHFSDQEIKEVLSNNLTIGEVLQKGDKSLEKEVLELTDQEIERKLQMGSRSAASEIEAENEASKSLSDSNEGLNKDAISRVLSIAENTFPEKKPIDLETISKGFGAIKGAMESENQLIATGLKDVPTSEIGSLTAPTTPNIESKNKAQERTR